MWLSLVELTTDPTKTDENGVPKKDADFSLSGGCFGTDIIQKYTKWFQIGVHRLKIGQIFAKCQCIFFG